MYYNIKSLYYKYTICNKVNTIKHMFLKRFKKIFIFIFKFK